MTHKHKIKFSPLFPNSPPHYDRLVDDHKNIASSNTQSSTHPNRSDHRYHPGDANTILFLSKRGMSRSPLAREILREKVGQSPFFGKFRVSSRGVTHAYDQCPIDGKLRKYADRLGYVLQGYSRFATLPDLAQADLIIPLDHESDDFTKVHRNAIRGKVQAFGQFLPSGSVPFLSDPYDREGDFDINDRYDEIIQGIRLGCTKILQSIPSLFS